MKKTILSTIITTVVFGLSQSAMAMDVAKNNLVKPMPKQTAQVATTTAANNVGHFYVEVAGGYAMNDWKKSLNSRSLASALGNADIVSTSVSSAKNGKTALQLNVGYMINKYFGVELGYTQLAKSSFDGSYLTTATDVATTKYNIKQHAIGLLGLAQYPLTQSIAVYGKAGVEYLHTSADLTQVDDSNAVSTAKFKKNTIAPTIALGVSYTLSSMPQLSFDAQYQEIFAKKRISTSNTSNMSGINVSQVKIKQPNIGIASVGVKYAF